MKSKSWNDAFVEAMLPSPLLLLIQRKRRHKLIDEFKKGDVGGKQFVRFNNQGGVK